MDNHLNVEQVVKSTDPSFKIGDAVEVGMKESDHLQGRELVMANDLNVEEVKSEPSFKVGDAVEVAMKEPDLEGSYYEARVTEVGGEGGNARTIRVQYDQIVEESDRSILLEEAVEASMLRPRPPCMQGVLEFRKGDLVEVSINDGWWIGKVSKVVSLPWPSLLSSFVVIFPDGDLREVSTSELRPRLDWVEGKWVPAKELAESDMKTVKRKRKQTRLPESTKRKPLMKPVTRRTKSGGSSNNVTRKCIDFDKVVEITTVKESSQACMSELSNKSACCFSALGDFATTGHATPDTVPVCGSSSKLELAETPPHPLEFYCFQKTSPIWDTFPTMQQFQMIPQDPHFRPLEQDSENNREKMAISMMIDYVDLVDSVYNPKSAIPLCNMDNREVLLKRLELNGFEVQDVRSRMHALIEQKNNCERDSLKMELGEIKKVKSQAELELDVIDKQMKELEQQRAVISKRIEEYECEGIMLQERLKMLEGLMINGMLTTV